MRAGKRGSEFVVLTAALLTGCAVVAGHTQTSLLYRHTPEGTVVWGEEFEFDPPPNDWNLVRVKEGDEEFSFAFLKMEHCPNPCQSTFAYDEEPFGYSRDLEERQKQFFDRFLWASRVRFGPAETREVQVLGGPGLVATAEAEDPVGNQKVWAKVVFGKRGERVVAFYLTQWRPKNLPFDGSVEQPFDRFVDSFRFLKESFFQKLTKGGEGPDTAPK